MVGIPAFNEAKTIAGVINGAKHFAGTVVVCDDGSKDDTYEMAGSCGARVLRHQANRGYGASLSTLFQFARRTDAELLVTMDADGQHHPENLPDLILPILNSEADVVIGSRFLAKSPVPWFRKLGIKIINMVVNFSTGLNLTDTQSGFRAYSRRAIESIAPSLEGMGASTEILIKAKEAGLKIKEVPVQMSYPEEISKIDSAIHGLSVVIDTFRVMPTHSRLNFIAKTGSFFLAAFLLVLSFISPSFAFFAFPISLFLFLPTFTRPMFDTKKREPEASIIKNRSGSR